jgi:hypothetical protein
LGDGLLDLDRGLSRGWSQFFGPAGILRVVGPTCYIYISAGISSDVLIVYEAPLLLALKAYCLGLRTLFYLGHIFLLDSSISSLLF